MQQQGNPRVEQNLNQDPTTNIQSGQNDDYRRDGAHLGEVSSEPDKADTFDNTQKGGGGAGYDVNREQQEVNREQEVMHNERDKDQLDPERTQTPQTDPGKVNPDQNPAQPETRPGTSTMGNYHRNTVGSWSQSSSDSIPPVN